MRVIALLSYYEESSSWLSATVASAARCCQHVVALDGAYAAFPDGRARSGPEQAQAILETANACDIGCTIHQPQTVWAGNEVEKRTALFEAGAAVAEPGDWYLVLDADEIVTDVPADLHERLDEVWEERVATVGLWWRDDPAPGDARDDLRRRYLLEPGGRDLTQRRLLQAFPGLRCETRHDRWVTEAPDSGRPLYLRGDGMELEPALDCTDLRIEHRHNQRDQWRRKQQFEYYRVRDENGLEAEKMGAT